MFVRVISSRKKWDRIPSKKQSFPADCFFDIRTTDNSLSLWEYTDNDSEDIVKECIVVAALGRQNISKVSYVTIDQKELEDENLHCSPKNPKCAFLNPQKEDFIHRHYDIQEIDHQDLLKIAKIIIKKVEAGEVETIPEKKVTEVFCKMRDEGILINKGLQDSIAEVIFPENP